jgi:cobalt-zinc-cadmium efflux system membrane fusion protein
VLSNPGLMRTGMFLTATFFGKKGVPYAAVPASAILHLHDRDWVFIPANNNSFQRVEVQSGKTLDNDMQIIQTGIQPGQQVVKDALALNAESEQ